MCWRPREKSDYFQATLGVGILWMAAQMIAAPGAPTIHWSCFISCCVDGFAFLPEICA